MRAVAISLGVLGITAVLQAIIFLASGSVALLADLIHNAGDALTAVPLGIAFFVRSARAELVAGYFVVLAIFVSACVALYQTIERLINPQELSNLVGLAAAGAVGFRGTRSPRRCGCAAAVVWTARRSSPTATMRASTASSRSAWCSAPRSSHSGWSAPTRGRDGHHARHPQDHLGLVANDPPRHP